MKAFFSSILKPAQPKQQQQQQQAYPSAVVDAKATPATAAAAANQTTANAASTAATSSSSSSQSASSSSSAVASSSASAASSAAATASSSTAAAASTPAATPAAAAPTSAAAAPAVSSVSAHDRKLAAASLDSYTGLVSCLFDHSIPLKREQEFFLERMEEAFGRDAVQEIPRANAAARSVNMELPIVREKGTLSCQHTNAHITATLAHCSSFFAAAAVKDESRRAHRLASLSRVKALQASLDAELSESKRQQHNVYVAEFAKMHDKYGRNLDGSKKKEYNATQNMINATTAAMAVAHSNAEAAAAAAAAAAANANAADAAATETTAAAEASSGGESSAAASSSDFAANEPATSAASADAAADSLPGAS